MSGEFRRIKIEGKDVFVRGLPQGCETCPKMRPVLLESSDFGIRWVDINPEIQGAKPWVDFPEGRANLVFGRSSPSPLIVRHGMTFNLSDLPGCSMSEFQFDVPCPEDCLGRKPQEGHWTISNRSNRASFTPYMVKKIQSE